MVYNILESFLVVGLAHRFLGEEGRLNRIEALLGQAIVGGNRELAEDLSDRVEVLAVEKAERLITQDDSDDDLYFIVSGSFSIVVNGQQVATRGRGDHIGEMAVIEPTQGRAASAVADEEAVVAKLTAGDLQKTGALYPEIYRYIARSLSRRLRERNKMVGQYRERIKVFIISSAEALPVARAVQNAFQHDPFLTLIWTDGVFRAANYTLEALEAVLDDSDFAIAVAHGDDLTQFRGLEWPTPRDNVVFELGLFMGKLGRSRAILMEPREDKIKLPSDLSGVTTITYRYNKGEDLSALLAPACNLLRDYINELGPYNG